MGSKIKLEDVQKAFEEQGWKLISTIYTNLKTELEAECPKGHRVWVTFDRFRKGNYKCPICEELPYATSAAIPTKKPKNTYRVLAFDQATITSGWSLFDNEELKGYGHWTSSGSKSTEKIALTKYWFVSMIKKYNPDVVLLEDIQLQKFQVNGNEGDAVLTFKKLAHLQGVLKNYLYENGIPYEVVSPSTWRSYSEIKGKTRSDKKRNAQLKVEKLFNVKCTQDEADAILIGRYGARNHQKNEIITF